ncbi:DegV family protein [Lachnoclostridium edouardi]|uniref:DegV family protein n=1 Tax=Lachnoclostridium edouardi TaxID=1926283 RepID=UPI000C7A7681|nr:DegV family protein [Lachnoclostridium edouardi]
MTYKIIGDSCLDLTDELKKDPHFQTVPLTLQVGNAQITDDETFDQKNFLELVRQCPQCPQSACPSPDCFKEAFECEAENIFVITISEHLSGGYNSAMVAKQLYEEEHGEGEKNIAVFSSDSASSGQLNMALFIQDLCKENTPFDEIVRKTRKFRDEMGTYFVLETLDTLRKNGRLTGLQAFFATALNIKPIMSAEKGVIIKLDQARGINKALSRMCDIIDKNIKSPEEKRLIIAHCNNEKRAELVKEEMEKRAQFKEIIITKTAGVATLYANDGGVIVAV